MTYIEYPKCSTCAKYKKELEQSGLQLKTRHIVEEPPTFEEIKTFHEKSGLDIKKFFNTSGLKYRELMLKDKLPTMELEEKYQLLASDGMLIKRPILSSNDLVLVGKDVLNATSENP